MGVLSLPSQLFSFPFLDLPFLTPSHTRPLPSSPLEVGALNLARGFGECRKLPQRVWGGVGRSRS